MRDKTNELLQRLQQHGHGRSALPADTLCCLHVERNTPAPGESDAESWRATLVQSATRPQRSNARFSPAIVKPVVVWK